MNQDLVLQVSASVDPACFDITRYEPFLDGLCGPREYQQAIRVVLHYVGIKQELEASLQQSVDVLHYREGMNASLKRRIEREAIHA